MLTFTVSSICRGALALVALLVDDVRRTSRVGAVRETPGVLVIFINNLRSVANNTLLKHYAAIGNRLASLGLKIIALTPLAITIRLPIMRAPQAGAVLIGTKECPAPCILVSVRTGMTSERPLVGIIMGSQSDWPTMKHAAEALDGLGVAYETKIVSAHRTPDRLVEYAKSAKGRGLKCIIAGAGGAAHLPGMAAAMTPLPVFGVPVQSSVLSGKDSLLSIVQMPGGVPVGTLAIGKAGAKNAGLLAGAVIALMDDAVAAKLDDFRAAQTESVAIDPVDES